MSRLLILLLVAVLGATGKRIKRQWPSGPSSGWDDDGTLSVYQTFYPEMSPYGYTAEETYYPGQKEYKPYPTYESQSDTADEFSKKRGRRDYDQTDLGYGGNLDTGDLGLSEPDVDQKEKYWRSDLVFGQENQENSENFADQYGGADDKYDSSRTRRDDWEAGFYDREKDEFEMPEEPQIPPEDFYPMEDIDRMQTRGDLDDSQNTPDSTKVNPELVESVQAPNRVNISIIDENGKPSVYDSAKRSPDPRPSYSEKSEEQKLEEPASTKTTNQPEIFHIDEKIVRKSNDDLYDGGNPGGEKGFSGRSHSRMQRKRGKLGGRPAVKTSSSNDDIYNTRRKRFAEFNDQRHPMRPHESKMHSPSYPRQYPASPQHSNRRPHFHNRYSHPQPYSPNDRYPIRNNLRKRFGVPDW